MATLDAAWEAAQEAATPTLAVISGPPGVGKTSLALSWLHRHRGEFPDGQLYVDLRGHSTDQPVSPSTVLPGFLRACGAQPDQVPVDLAEQTALFRTLTDERKLAVLCDNALSAAQVRALLPTTSGSVCVVTSRWRLTSLILDGARIIPLEPLDADAAVQLLSHIAGTERIAADYMAAQDLVASCGHFPLAVCVGGALLTARPGWSIAAVAADLVAGSRSAVADEELSMIACLDQAYAAISVEARRLYRRLGIHPAPDFGVGVIEVVAAAEPAVPDVPRLLAALVEANLLTIPAPFRYRFHDLIQRHALGCAQADDPEELRSDCVARIADYYLATANSADAVLYPQRRRPAPTYTSTPPALTTFPDPAAALEWLDFERGNLVAVQRLADEHGMATVTWQIADAIWGLFAYLRHYQDWIATHELGVAAARTCGHRLGEARLRNGLGVALREVGRVDEALRVFDDALALRREIGDRRGEALVLHNLALTHQARGDLDQTLSLLHQALAIHEDVGGPRDQARNHSAVGEVESRLGHHDAAIAHLTQAREMVTGTQDRYEAIIERLLGLAHLRRGNRTVARLHLGAALECLARTGTVYDEGTVHEMLAAVDEQDGDQTSALAHYGRAETVYGKLGALMDQRRVAEHRLRLDTSSEDG